MGEKDEEEAEWEKNKEDEVSGDEVCSRDRKYPAMVVLISGEGVVADGTHDICSNGPSRSLACI